MQSDTAASRPTPPVLDGIDRPIGKIARRADKRDGVLVNGPFDRRGLDHELVVHRKRSASLRLKYWAALWNAACAEIGTTISGSVMPFVVRAQSRYVFIARRMLSEPPDVTEPQTPFSLPTGARAGRRGAYGPSSTRSPPRTSPLGQRSVWSGLDCE